MPTQAADAFTDGLVTGTGTLIKGPADSKTRELTLRNVSSLNDWTDGTVLQGGTLRIFTKAVKQRGWRLATSRRAVRAPVRSL